jgi:hypothetical protein
MPQGIHGHMHLRAAAAFGPVIARVSLSGVDCRVRLSQMAAEGSLGASGDQPHNRAEVMDDHGKHASLEPALALLVYGILWRQIMGQQTPRGARLDNLAQAIQRPRACCAHAEGCLLS